MLQSAQNRVITGRHIQSVYQTLSGQPTQRVADQHFTGSFYGSTSCPDSVTPDSTKSNVNTSSGSSPTLGNGALPKNTIRLAVTTLRTLLNAAAEDEVIEHNPAQGLGRFVKSEKATREATSLKPKEVERLLRPPETRSAWRTIRSFSPRSGQVSARERLRPCSGGTSNSATPKRMMTATL